MTKYKITNTENKTHCGYQWAPREWQETSGTGPLCADGWLHCYHHPLLAVIMNPIHGDFRKPYKLWEVEVGGKFKDDCGLKCGYSRMRLVQAIAVPDISMGQQVVFSILCAKRVCDDEKWNEWADNWLSEKDRSPSAAYSAVDVAYAAASHSAADASAAAYAAYAAGAYAAAFAWYSAAAYHVAWAAVFAARVSADDFLIECAETVMELE